MLGGRINRRHVIARAGGDALLAGCKVIPKVEPTPTSTPGSDADRLAERQGPSPRRAAGAAVGPQFRCRPGDRQCRDHGAARHQCRQSAHHHLRYRHRRRTALRRARFRDGNKLILGPLLAEDVTPCWRGRARPACR